MPLSPPYEDSDKTDNRFHRKRRRRRKPQGQEAPLDSEIDQAPISGGSSSLDETIRVLLRLRSLEVQVEKIIVDDVRGDSSTTHRLQNLAHHACGKLSRTLGPCIQPLDQFVTTLESTFIEVQANTTRFDETRFLENEIHNRLDKCTVDFEHDFNRLLLAVPLLAERETDVAPPATTTFFQGAQNITINGGYFGHSVDNKVQNQYRWILSILIFNTGVLLS